MINQHRLLGEVDLVSKIIQDRICRNTGGRMVVVDSMDYMYGRKLYYVMDFVNNRCCSTYGREMANIYSSYPDLWKESGMLSSGFGVETCPGYPILESNGSRQISPQHPVKLIDGDVLLVEYRGSVYSIRALNAQLDVVRIDSTQS